MSDVLAATHPLKSSEPVPPPYAPDVLCVLPYRTYRKPKIRISAGKATWRRAVARFLHTFSVEVTMHDSPVDIADAVAAVHRIEAIPCAQLDAQLTLEKEHSELVDGHWSARHVPAL